jgi:hypothetical protein
MLLFLDQPVPPEFYQNFGLAFFQTYLFLAQVLNPHRQNIRNLNNALTLKPYAWERAASRSIDRSIRGPTLMIIDVALLGLVEQKAPETAVKFIRYALPKIFEETPTARA